MEPASRNFRALIRKLTGTTVAVLLGMHVARAQSGIDPSSALLLRPTSSSPDAVGARPNPGLESGRYTVRPRAGTSETARPTTSRRTPEPAPSAAIVPIVPPAAVAIPATEQGVVVIPTAPMASALVPTPTPQPADTATTTPSLAHLLDLSVSTLFLFENSDSNHSYRRYNMNGPGYQATARAWLSPEFAVGGTYLSTLAGYVSDGAANVTATRSEFSFGAFFRRHFAASSLTIGIESVDSELKVSGDATRRVKTKTTGFRFSVDGEYETDSASRWTLGFSVTPKAQHQESATALDFRSGENPESYIVGAAVGRRWQMNDANALFIRIQHTVERNLFTGPASGVDPETSATPSGVSATTGTTLIQFGYGWGG